MKASARDLIAVSAVVDAVAWGILAQGDHRVAAERLLALVEGDGRQLPGEGVVGQEPLRAKVAVGVEVVPPLAHLLQLLGDDVMALLEAHVRVLVDQAVMDLLRLLEQLPILGAPGVEGRIQGLGEAVDGAGNEPVGQPLEVLSLLGKGILHRPDDRGALLLDPGLKLLLQVGEEWVAVGVHIQNLARARWQP